MGTVTISLKHYNELRDFKTKIESGHIYVVESSGWGFNKYYVTENEMMDRLNDEITELKKEVTELEKSTTFKKMSCRKFKKWKKNNL